MSEHLDVALSCKQYPRLRTFPVALRVNADGEQVYRHDRQK